VRAPTKTQSHQRRQDSAPVYGGILEAGSNWCQGGQSSLNQNWMGKLWTWVHRETGCSHSLRCLKDGAANFSVPNGFLSAQTFLSSFWNKVCDGSDDTFLWEITEILRNWEDRSKKKGGGNISRSTGTYKHILEIDWVDFLSDHKKHYIYTQCHDSFIHH